MIYSRVTSSLYRALLDTLFLQVTGHRLINKTHAVEIFTEIHHFMLMWKFEDLGSPTVAPTVRDLG